MSFNQSCELVSQKVWRALITPLTFSNVDNYWKCFSIHEQINQFWFYQICKHDQNITSRLVFTTVFGLHCNFFIVLTLQIYWFCLITNVRAEKISRIPEVLSTRARPICLVLHIFFYLAIFPFFKSVSYIFLFRVTYSI